MRVSSASEARDAHRAAVAEHGQALKEWQSSPSDGRWERVRSLEARVAQFEALVSRFDAQETEAANTSKAARADELRALCSAQAFAAALQPEIATLANLAREVQRVAARVHDKVDAGRAAHVELTEIVRDLGGSTPPQPDLSYARGTIRRGLAAALRTPGAAYVRADEIGEWLQLS